MLRFHKYYFSYSSLISDLYSIDLAVRIYTKNNRYAFPEHQLLLCPYQSILSRMTESQCLIPTSQSPIIIFVFVHLHIFVAGICIQVCGFIPILVMPACIWLPCSILAEDPAAYTPCPCHTSAMTLGPFWHVLIFEQFYFFSLLLPPCQQKFNSEINPFKSIKKNNAVFNSKQRYICQKQSCIQNTRKNIARTQIGCREVLNRSNGPPAKRSGYYTAGPCAASVPLFPSFKSAGA